MADPVFGDFTQVSAEIDAIFSGHTHQPYAFQVPVPGTTKTRPVIQAEDYGEKLGKAVLTYDPATRSVTASTAELLTVTGVTAERRSRRHRGHRQGERRRARQAAARQDHRGHPAGLTPTAPRTGAASR